MKRSDLLNEIDRAPGTSGTYDPVHSAAVIGADRSVGANLGEQMGRAQKRMGPGRNS